MSADDSNVVVKTADKVIKIPYTQAKSPADVSGCITPEIFTLSYNNPRVY